MNEGIDDRCLRQVMHLLARKEFWVLGEICDVRAPHKW